MMLIFLLCGVARQKRFVQGEPVQRERWEKGWDESLHCDGDECRGRVGMKVIPD